MKYRLLNEVLIEWNESSFEDSDNVFLKSEDIKKSLDKYFVYRLNKKEQIKIFGAYWPEYEKYKDKAWINGKHVKLNDNGRTVDKFTPGEYKVYIEDINKIIDISYMFSECKQLVFAFIPNSVTEIGELAFDSCSSLMNITIPDSVTSIGWYAFSNCSGLTSVTIPDSVTEIGGFAFYKCDCLNSVTISGSVTYIGASAFTGCFGLTSITIPNSITYIGESAFKNCRNLKTVYVEDIN